MAVVNTTNFIMLFVYHVDDDSINSYGRNGSGGDKLLDEDNARKGDGMERSNNNDDNNNMLMIGSSVECQYRGKSKYYPATIKRNHGNDTFDLLYEDGDREFRVSKDLIRLQCTSIDTRKNTNSIRNLRDDSADHGFHTEPTVQFGSKLRKQQDYQSNISDDILSSDNAQRLRGYTHLSTIRPSLQPKSISSRRKFLDEQGFQIPPSTKSLDNRFQYPTSHVIGNSTNNLILTIGTAVEAMYMSQGVYYPGHIIGIGLDGSHYDIKYDDGDMERNVPRSSIRKINQQGEHDNDLIVSSNISNQNNFRFGSRIKARFRGGDVFYPGTITDIQAHSTFDILYDDGFHPQNFIIV